MSVCVCVHATVLAESVFWGAAVRIVGVRRVVLEEQNRDRLAKQKVRSGEWIGTIEGSGALLADLVGVSQWRPSRKSQCQLSDHSTVMGNTISTIPAPLAVRYPPEAQ